MRQRIAQTPMGRVHALQTTGFASQCAAHEPLCKETLGQTDTQDRLRTGVSPCSSPMRNLEEVIKTRWAEVMWVSSGVRTVRSPQADAERRRTFSPPILEDRKHIINYQRQQGKRAKSSSSDSSALPSLTCF